MFPLKNKLFCLTNHWTGTEVEREGCCSKLVFVVLYSIAPQVPAESSAFLILSPVVIQRNLFSTFTKKEKKFHFKYILLLFLGRWTAVYSCLSLLPVLQFSELKVHAAIHSNRRVRTSLWIPHARCLAPRCLDLYASVLRLNQDLPMHSFYFPWIDWDWKVNWSVESLPCEPWGGKREKSRRQNYSGKCPHI